MKKQYFQPEVEYVKVSGRMALLQTVSPDHGPNGQPDPNNPFFPAPYRY